MNLGIIVDNSLDSDPRVQNEITILQHLEIDIYVLCFDFGNAVAHNSYDFKVERIKISKKLKEAMFLANNSFPFYDWFWAKKIQYFIDQYVLQILHVHDLYMSEPPYLGIKKSKYKPRYNLDQL